MLNWSDLASEDNSNRLLYQFPPDTLRVPDLAGCLSGLLGFTSAAALSLFTRADLYALFIFGELPARHSSFLSALLILTPSFSHPDDARVRSSNWPFFITPIGPFQL
jgi:hypothetical protein